MDPRPIHDDAELAAAKAEIERLWNAAGADDQRRLADWGELVDLYESGLIRSAGDLDPVEVIAAEMAMNGRSRADLARLIGENRATEILARRRPLTLPMIRALHGAWGIPADLLIGAYETA